jgi:hypothetical protein
MAQLVINVGAAPNDGLGDPIRTAYQKCNTNFSELYSRVQTTPPTTLVGTVGDSAGMYAYDSNYFYYCFADYDGSSIIWAQVTQAGNAAVTQISNGTSAIKIPNINSNAAVDIAGSSNVAIFSTLGFEVTGRISATGNVTGSTIYTTGNVVGALMIASGNVIGGNLTTGGIVSASGNITGNYLIGDGSQLTNIVSSGNTLTGNTLATGIINSSLTSVGILTTLSVSGNVTGGNIRTGGLITATGNVTSGNLLTGGLVSATGNINGNNIISLGSITTGGLEIFSPNYIDVTANALTINLSASTSTNFIVANNTGYTVTVNMPSTPVDGQLTKFTVVGNAITLDAGTGNTNISYVGNTGIGNGARYIYRSFDSTWYRTL